MLFVSHCLDAAGTQSLRQATVPAHRDYTAAWADRILIAGPLLGDDAATPIGSLFIIDASDRADVEAFHAKDPLQLAGVWREVRIHGFLKRVDRRTTSPATA